MTLSRSEWITLHVFAASCPLTNIRQRKQDRWTVSETKQLNLSLKSEAAQAFLTPENRITSANGKGWRWKSNVIKDCAAAVQRDLFERLGLQQHSDEDENAYSSRLWEYAKQFDCPFCAAENGETAANYDDRFRKLGEVSDWSKAAMKWTENAVADSRMGQEFESQGRRPPSHHPANACNASRTSHNRLRRIRLLAERREGEPAVARWEFDDNR